MKPQPNNTGEETTGKSIKHRFREYLAENAVSAVTQETWNSMLRSLTPVSESYLRELVHATGLPFDQPFAGIRQHTFEELEQSLCEMQQIYAEAVAAGDRDRARYCRRQVIAAKDRARYSSQNRRTAAEKRAQKEEMVQWMLVWLENPAVFPAWAAIRKRTLGSLNSCGS